MATLASTVYGSRGPDGYPMEGTVYRFYCDRCGSFRIRRFIPPVTWVALLLACALVGAGWQRLGSTRLSGVDWLGWWIAFAFLSVLPLSAVLALHGHKCDKCGNTAISNADVLHYSQRQPLVYDIPHERAHTHTNLHNRWYRELLKLPAVVALALVVMVLTAMIEIAVVIALAVSVFRPEQTGRGRPKNNS